jgi:hypothetical protein
MRKREAQRMKEKESATHAKTLAADFKKVKKQS